MDELDKTQETPKPEQVGHKPTALLRILDEKDKIIVSLKEASTKRDKLNESQIRLLSEDNDNKLHKIEQLNEKLSSLQSNYMESSSKLDVYKERVEQSTEKFDELKAVLKEYKSNISHTLTNISDMVSLELANREDRNNKLADRLHENYRKLEERLEALTSEHKSTLEGLSRKQGQAKTLIRDAMQRLQNAMDLLDLGSADLQLNTGVMDDFNSILRDSEQAFTDLNSRVRETGTIIKKIETLNLQLTETPKLDRHFTELGARMRGERPPESATAPQPIPGPAEGSREDLDAFLEEAALLESAPGTAPAAPGIPAGGTPPSAPATPVPPQAAPPSGGSAPGPQTGPQAGPAQPGTAPSGPPAGGTPTAFYGGPAGGAALPVYPAGGVMPVQPVGVPPYTGTGGGYGIPPGGTAYPASGGYPGGQPLPVFPSGGTLPVHQTSPPPQGAAAPSPGTATGGGGAATATAPGRPGSAGPAAAGGGGAQESTIKPDDDLIMRESPNLAPYNWDMLPATSPLLRFRRLLNNAKKAEHREQYTKALDIYEVVKQQRTIMDDALATNMLEDQIEAINRLARAQVSNNRKRESVERYYRRERTDDKRHNTDQD